MTKISLKFKKPRKVDILIYDRVGSEFIRRALNSERSWGIMDVREKSINTYPSVLFQLFLVIVQRGVRGGEYWRPFSFRLAVEFATIKAIQPKVVVTFIDNSYRFNILSRVYHTAKFFGVQNGFRGIEVMDMSKRLCLTNFFCFGEETKRRYQLAGCEIGRFIVGGSIKDGLYRKTHSRYYKKIYDLCWVSQYRPSRFEKTMPGLRRTSLELLEFIQQYCVDNGKTLAIACSCKEREFSYEYQFLLDVIQLKGVSIIPNDDNNFSSYRLIDQSRVTITSHSTIGFESLARGCKVLFCNFTDDSYYDVPSGYNDGVWSLRGPNIKYRQFSERLTEIYDLSDNRWLEITQKMGQYFVRTNGNALPPDLLAQEIEAGIVEFTN